MILEVIVPSVGESITEGVLAAWSVADGAYVEKGAPLFELETDKASSEVPSPESGVVHHRASKGQEVKIGAVVGTIDTSASKQNGTPAATKQVDTPQTVTSEALAQRSAAKAPAEDERVVASSVAKKLAAEHKIELRQVKGTGTGGRITREDVEAAVGSRGSATAPAVPPPPPQSDRSVGSVGSAGSAEINSSSPDTTRERMTTIRKKIAERLVMAQQTTAMLTTFNDVDMSAVMQLRAQYKDAFKDKHGVGLGFMSFFVKACIEGLRAFPRVNAMIDGDDIVYHKQFHIGVAVSTPRGLIVPVIKNSDRLSFSGIEKTIADFGARGKEGKVEVNEMQGGTFTISNGGVFGSMLSTPILNPPQSGILGMHRIEERPVARDGQVVIRPMMYLALSYDHRIIDGREAVGFLVKVKECIETPARMMLEV